MSDLKHDVTTCHVTVIQEPFPTFMNFTGNLKKYIINTCNQLVFNWKKPTTMLSKTRRISDILYSAQHRNQGKHAFAFKIMLLETR